jgi:hypothetical protein
MKQRKHPATPQAQARRPPRAQPPTLTVLHPNAAGIDVHSDMHMVCASLLPEETMLGSVLEIR